LRAVLKIKIQGRTGNQNSKFGTVLEILKMAPKRCQPVDPAEAKKRKADYDRARRVQMTEIDKARKAESSRAH
jgi:hypothetical protein